MYDRCPKIVRTTHKTPRCPVFAAWVLLWYENNDIRVSTKLEADIQPIQNSWTRVSFNINKT